MIVQLMSHSYFSSNIYLPNHLVLSFTVTLGSFKTLWDIRKYSNTVVDRLELFCGIMHVP